MLDLVIAGAVLALVAAYGWLVWRGWKPADSIAKNLIRPLRGGGSGEE